MTTSLNLRATFCRWLKTTVSAACGVGTQHVVSSYGRRTLTTKIRVRRTLGGTPYRQTFSTPGLSSGLNGLRVMLVAAVAMLALTEGRASSAWAQTPMPDPDLQAQNVPHGIVKDYVWKTSHVYPGTEHRYRVYIPAQYDASKPACVMIFQDGLGFNAPTVFDNLIAKKQMPVTVAIGINPGVAPPSGANPNNALPRFNRSVEYDTPDDTYARFLLDEILPEVEKTVNLSQNPNDRGLCGGSSGGIAAFVAAWERPDQFRRVYSVIGSFTDLAGGDTFPSKIRKCEPKPLRIYLQDNDQDQDIYSGSWPLANQEVAAALKFAGYDTQFAVGKGGHDGRPGSLIFPEVMRWLWRDYPAPITAATTTSRQPIMQIVSQGDDWQEVEADVVHALTTDSAGNVYAAGRDGITCIGTPSVKGFSTVANVSALAFTPDGRLIVADAVRRRLTTYDASGKATPFARNVSISSLTINHQGMMYFQNASDGSLWQMTKNGQRRKVAEGEAVLSTFNSQPSTLALTPDQSLLITTGSEPRKSLISWRIQSDGTLADGESFFDLTIPYRQTGTQATAMVTDTQGWLYVTTPAGIQVCDQAGRVNGILSLPTRRTPTAMTWGGANRDTLYLACGDHLYKRKLRVKGVLPFEEPIKPPSPRL